MHILVTGGTGVVGKPVVDRLAERGHTVRLLSRDAEQDARQWPWGVEPWPGSVASADDVRGAAEGCQAVLHVASVERENPPEVTFQRVNVDGTRLLLEEAERSGVRRFVYVSSLGADRGESDYHRSKAAAEALVRGWGGEWMILRPGNVYGPGDQVISVLLHMVRALPAVPVVGDGEQPFQPVWTEDLAEAIAAAVERGEPQRVYELAGAERVTTNQVLDVLEEVTGRHPARIPVPAVLAEAGTAALEGLGVEFPFNRDQVVMVQEGNVIEPPERNALTAVFGVEPISLWQGVRLLADSQPEQLPSEGVGRLHRQRHWADIRGSGLDAAGLMRVLRHEFAVLTPEVLAVGTEPHSEVHLEPGATLGLKVPLRGTVQVRVEEVGEEAVTLATLDGHHLAGVIRFQARNHDDAVRFEICSYTRAANWLDWVGRMAGKPLQQSTWRRTVEAVVERCGGRAEEGVQTEEEVLSEDAAERVEGWAEEVVLRRKRAAAD